MEEGIMGEELSEEKIEERSGMLQEEITKEEIRRGVGKLKKGKAEGVCGTSGELLKAGGEVVIEWLVKIYNMVWRTGVAPEDLQRAIIKVFSRILNNRVRLMTDNRLLGEQAVFRSGRGSIDQIFVIRQLVEKHLEKGKKMFAAFVDLEKAYDKVWRADLWRALREYGMVGWRVNWSGGLAWQLLQ